MGRPRVTAAMMAFPFIKRGAKALFRIAAVRVHQLRILLWRVTGKPPGVHAVPFTSGGKVVLVKLSYASGWRVPGGGIRRGEALGEAAARELREEIGMTGCRAIERMKEAGLGEAGPAAGGALFVVTDVEYRPRRSFEIESVQEFDPDLLPRDVSPFTRRWIARATAHRAQP